MCNIFKYSKCRHAVKADIVFRDNMQVIAQQVLWAFIFQKHYEDELTKVNKIQSEEVWFKVKHDIISKQACIVVQ